MAMPTLPLIVLVLCHTTCILQAQAELEEVESDMDSLEKELQQGCSSAHHARERLNRLEKKLARQEKLNFTGGMVETYMFKFMAERFRGLKLSSRMDMKPGGGSRLRHAMNFPAELMEGVQAREAEQKLVCIYIHSPCLFHDADNSSVLNDDVLGAFLQSGSVAGLSRPVEIQFWHDMVLDASNATCVFWQPGASAGSAGSWSRYGCETTHMEGTVICRCNHLTYFAVLLVPAGTLTPAQLASLTHISTIGCSLSAAAALCTLLLCCFSRSAHAGGGGCFCLQERYVWVPRRENLCRLQERDYVLAHQPAGPLCHALLRRPHPALQHAGAGEGGGDPVEHPAAAGPGQEGLGDRAGAHLSAGHHLGLGLLQLWRLPRPPALPLHHPQLPARSPRLPLVRHRAPPDQAGLHQQHLPIMRPDAGVRGSEGSSGAAP
ncbi:adhesion G-protein coupled receptor G5-like isoform X6 [Opisthocomus hoazin]|uniref:adhesion G-protein coupled receptor G5-like isoform X6 n=1 Tax=Opisthocomus hoazin TaxID=30419 RepID=UPI003F53DC13